MIQETLTKRETQILQLRGECDHELMMVKLQAIQDNVRLKQEQDKIMKIHDDAVHEKALQLVDIKSNTIYGENVALVNRLREFEKEIRKGVWLKIPENAFDTQANEDKRQKCH